MIAEYVNVWVGRIMAPYSKRKAKQAQKNAADPNAKDRAKRQRSWLIAWLDYKNFSPVDTRLLWRKAVDPVLAGLSSLAINLAWVARPWVEANDSLTAVLTRFGVAAVSVWLIGRLIRDPDEHRNGYYGYRGQRALRSPARPSRWFWIGDRLHRRVVDYRKDLDALLGQFELKGRLNQDLAEKVAARLWTRMSAEIHEPLGEWEPLRPRRSTCPWPVSGRPPAGRRIDHVKTIKLVVPVLAADPDALARVAKHLRDVGKIADAEVVEFQRMLSEALWAKADPAPKQAAASRVWTERLAKALKERNALRTEYLEGPRRALLEEIKQYYLDKKEFGQPEPAAGAGCVALAGVRGGGHEQAPQRAAGGGCPARRPARPQRR